MWRRTKRRDVGIQLSLKDRATECELVAGVLDGRDVGDERPAEARRKRRREITGLIRVRKENQRWLLLFDQRFQREQIAISGVLGERLRLEHDDLDRFCTSDVGRSGISPRPEQRDLE